MSSLKDISAHHQIQQPPSTQEKDMFSLDNTIQFTIKWAPRALCAALFGYYSLGISYDIGLMHEIDKIAILVLKNTVGYAGLGAAMPTFQWYAALGVRCTAALIGGVLYDLSERATIFFYSKCYRSSPHLSRASFHLMA